MSVALRPSLALAQRAFRVSKDECPDVFVTGGTCECQLQALAI
jgi:hypothetical protein